MPARSIICLCVIFAASCAPRRAEIGLEGSAPAPGELLGKIAAERSALGALAGKGELTFESPERSGSVFFRFAVRRPDSLLIRLQGPFGIEVGSLLLTPDASLFYNAMENTLLSGNATMRRIQTFLPFPIDRGGLLDLFAGQIPTPRDTASLGVGREGDGLTLTGRYERSTTTWEIDPDDWTVRRMAVVDSSGTITLEAEASEFRSIDGISLPGRVRFAMPEEGRFLSVYFTSRTVNGDLPRFQLSVPPSARRITR
jgi:hypothetical protein